MSPTTSPSNHNMNNEESKDQASITQMTQNSYDYENLFKMKDEYIFVFCKCALFNIYCYMYSWI